MDKSYITLFKELTRAAEVAAEQVMEYDHLKGLAKEEETAKMMRDDYAQLHDKIEKGEILSKNDYAKLLAGAYIVSNNLRDRATALKKAIAGYETDLMPKLQAIVEGSTTDEEANKLANEKLIIE
jgi:hypothetical protein